MLKNAEYRLKYEREDVETVLLDFQEDSKLYALRSAHFEEKFQHITSGSSPSALSSLQSQNLDIDYDEIDYYMSLQCSLLDLYKISLGNLDSLLNPKTRHHTNPNPRVDKLLQSIEARLKSSIDTPLITDYVIYQSSYVLDTIMSDIVPLL